MLIGGTVAYQILCWIAPPSTLSRHANPSAHREVVHSILESYFTPAEWAAIAGKTVVDYGCGTGGDAFALLRRGAAHVIGVDVREWIIGQARENAQAAGLADRCTFLLGRDTQGVQADAITCTADVMEHVDDPDEALRRHGPDAQARRDRLHLVLFTVVSPPRRPPVLRLPVGASHLHREGDDPVEARSNAQLNGEMLPGYRVESDHRAGLPARAGALPLRRGRTEGHADPCAAVAAQSADPRVHNVHHPMPSGPVPGWTDHHDRWVRVNIGETPGRGSRPGNGLVRDLDPTRANFAKLNAVNNAPNLRAVRRLFGSAAVFVAVLAACWFLLP